MRPDAENAVRAAGDAFPLKQDGPDDLREREREHREIDAGEPHGEPAEQKRPGEPGERRGHKGERRGRGEKLDQQAGAIGAEPEIGGVAEAVQARRAHDEMQRGREQDRDQHVDAEHESIRLVLDGERQQQKRDRQRGGENFKRQPCRPDRLLDFRVIAHQGLWTAEQAIGAHDQHHRHDQKFCDQRQLGEIHREAAEIDEADADAQRLHLGDDDRGEERAHDRTHPADHHDHESIADHDQVESEIRRLARHLQRPAEAGEEGAEREHDREQQRLVDAQRSNHFAILRSSANEPAEPGPRQHQVEQQQNQRAGGDQE